jgi:hypothetical protein
VTGFLSVKFADVRLQRFVVDGQDRLAQGLNQERFQVWHGERQAIKQMRAHLLAGNLSWVDVFGELEVERPENNMFQLFGGAATLLVWLGH